MPPLINSSYGQKRKTHAICLLDQLCKHSSKCAQVTIRILKTMLFNLGKIFELIIASKLKCLGFVNQNIKNDF